MTRTLRFVLGGIAAAYLVCVAAQLLSPNPALSSNQAFGVAVVTFIVIALGLHLAAMFLTRSLAGILLSLTSLAVLAVLFLRALMIVTGDSL